MTQEFVVIMLRTSILYRVHTAKGFSVIFFCVYCILYTWPRISLRYAFMFKVALDAAAYHHNICLLLGTEHFTVA